MIGNSGVIAIVAGAAWGHPAVRAPYPATGAVLFFDCAERPIDGRFEQVNSYLEVSPFHRFFYFEYHRLNRLFGIAGGAGITLRRHMGLTSSSIVEVNGRVVTDIAEFSGVSRQ